MILYKYVFWSLKKRRRFRPPKDLPRHHPASTIYSEFTVSTLKRVHKKLKNISKIFYLIKYFKKEFPKIPKGSRSLAKHTHTLKESEASGFLSCDERRIPKAKFLTNPSVSHIPTPISFHSLPVQS